MGPLRGYAGVRLIPDEPGEVMPTGPMMRFRSKRRLKPRWNRKAFARKGHRWLSAEKLEARNRPPRPIRASVAGLSTNSFFIASRRNLSRNALLPRQDRENLRNLEPQLTIFARCDGSGLSRQDCGSISRPLPTTSNAIGGCKAPKRTRNEDLQNRPSAKPATTTPSHCSAGDLQSATILKCLPNHTDAASHPANKMPPPRTDLKTY